MKLECTTAGANLYLLMSGASIATLLGTTATLAVRMFVPTGSSLTTGRLAVLVNNGASSTITTQSNNAALDGWHWRFIHAVAIPADTVYIRVYLYGDTTASAGSTVYYDRAVLVAGSIPRDMS